MTIQNQQEWESKQDKDINQNWEFKRNKEIKEYLKELLTTFIKEKGDIELLFNEIPIPDQYKNLFSTTKIKQECIRRAILKKFLTPDQFQTLFGTRESLEQDLEQDCDQVVKDILLTPKEYETLFDTDKNLEKRILKILTRLGKNSNSNVYQYIQEEALYLCKHKNDNVTMKFLYTYSSNKHKGSNPKQIERDIQNWIKNWNLPYKKTNWAFMNSLKNEVLTGSTTLV